MDVFVIIYLDDILIFSKTEEEYKEYIKKDFIRELTSLIRYFILWVSKKDGSLKLYINYRLLNNITVKNSYPLLLISEL